MRAGIAATGRIDRVLVLRIFRVLDVETASAREQLAVAGVPGRQDAVEHIDAAGDAFDQVLGRSRTHQVSWRIRWQAASRFLNDGIHLVDGLPDTQAADSIALEPDG